MKVIEKCSYLPHWIRDGKRTLYLFVNKINGFIEESNGNKYLVLVPTDEAKDTLKTMKNYEKKSKILQYR